MDDEEFESIGGLRTSVEQAGNVKTVRMWSLRDAYGAGRLGVHVRTNISKALRGHGLGHYPPELPEYQEDFVRIYTLGSTAGELIEAVLHLSDEADDVIRDRAGRNSDVVLEKIRELVC